MSLLVPLGLIACSALWLKGLKSLWGRGLLLAAFLGLLAVLLPSVTQDRSAVSLSIYQKEAQTFAAGVAAHIERGDIEGAKRRLLYFSANQKWSTANDSDALRGFYKDVELAGQGAAAPAPQSTPARASQ